MGHKVSSKEFQEHLKSQIKFLLSSVKAYDEGNIEEARRLALHLRVLLHDTDKSTSLLAHLQMKNIGFYDSASIVDELAGVTFIFQLTRMCVSSQDGVHYIAPLDDDMDPNLRNQKSPFEIWWNKPIYIVKPGRFSRKDLILNVANKDGGAHVDNKLTEEYWAFKQPRSIGITVVTGGRINDIRNSPVFPSIRQIAHEVIKTLRDEFPNLFD